MELKLLIVLEIILTFSKTTATETAVTQTTDTENDSTKEQDSDDSASKDLFSEIEKAFAFVNREDFLDKDSKNMTQYDGPISIGCDQTTSQPSLLKYIVTLLCIKKTDTVLEIGTGCGYLTAILAFLGDEVYTIEKIQELYSEAMKKFATLGFTNIHGRCQSGEISWRDGKTFDKIIVSAACEEVYQIFLDQLAPNGILILPVVSSQDEQMRVLVKKDEFGNVTQTDLCQVRFVPFVKD
jgi:protein-L-isoaspartate(D-aspartate) O-methyltransferase